MIRDFNDLKESGLMYGGQAGDKLGVIIDDENWFLKFPKSTKGMKRVDMSYTTSQLSEYLGSHIYQILGYDTYREALK